MQLPLPSRLFTRSAIFVSLLGGAALGASCAKSTSGDPSGFGGSSGGGTSGGGSSGTLGAGGSLGSGGTLGSGGAGTGSATLGGAGCSGPCQDFQSDPIVADTNVPSNASTLFGPATNGSSSGGPCLYEPSVSSGSSPGALFPNNWLRPIFEFTAPSGQSLFEIRIVTAAEANPLVVYTTKTSWTMPLTLWTALAKNAMGVPITVSVRGMASGGGTPSLGTSGDIQIAPAAATGAMVFWSTASFLTNSTSTNLQGFQVGDEGTTLALSPTQVQQQVWAQPPTGGNFPQPPVLEPVGCIGCHTSTPDGNYVGFTAQWPWPNALASVEADSGTPVGAAPPWLTASAINNLGPNTNDANYLGGTYVSATNNVDDVMLGVQTFSQAHYAAGDHIEITSVGAAKDQPDIPNTMTLAPIQPSGVTSQLIWINLEFAGDATMGRPSAAPGALSNGGWGVLARGGDSQSAGTPSWSHDGNTIAYTSVNGGTMDGRLDAPLSGSADVMTIPYANKAGGQATAVPGASDPTVNEYFPSFAPDDSLIAFNRVPSSATMYQQPLAEVWVVPATGAASGATRLASNDPPSCTNTKSPGVQNTWPKWAPGPSPGSDGNTYYWVTFSSTRSPDSGGKTQLYVSGIMKTPSGVITTYPAIYLWNQDPTVNNLIPAWDKFTIAHGTTPPPPR